MTLTPRELLEQDRALEARELALSFTPHVESLSPSQLEGIQEYTAQVELIKEHTAHLQSSEAYQAYYRTMRGAPCPEADIFTRHHFVKRFASIRRLILGRKHKTVLDLGCLDGWQLLNLAAQGVSGVGVDLCPQSLAVARERAAKWGMKLLFIESPIEDFDIIWKAPSAASAMNCLHFDAVILSEVLEHVLDPLACLKTAAKHLGKGGVLYVSVPASPVPHHGKLEDAREHLRVFSEDELKSLAKEAGLAMIVDQEVIDEDDQGQPFSHRMISFRRAQVTVYCNHVTGGWNPEDADNLGASEEMVVKVAESWARQGHEVTIHQNGYDGVHNGVVYLPRAIAPEPDRDLLVLYKTLEHLDRAAGTKVFWTTDLPQPGQVASFLPPVAVDQLDAVVCISEYHRQELLRACPWLSPEKTKAHWLGVDTLELSGSVRGSVGKRVIYASSPDRGLGFLLEEWPNVRAAVPDAELRVVYGFDFWKKSEAVVPADQAQLMRQERQRLELLLQQPGVVYRGRLSREDYLQEMNEATIWAYPCTGGELCCKTALEAQYLALYPVVIPTMVLQETVQTGSKVTREEFIPELIRGLKEETCGGAAHIPSWNDLANFLFGLMKEQSQVVSTTVQIPTDSGVQEESLPERFDRPKRNNMPKVGLDILMAVRGMSFDGETDRKASIGGSETAAIQLSRALVKRGHHVSVFSNLPEGPGKWDGVNYLHVNDWSRYAQSSCHDVSIVQRDPTAFNQQLRSKLNVLWAHDLGLARYRSTFRPSLWNVDYVAPVSHWHGRQLCEVYELPPSLIAPMYNGIEVEEIRRIAGRGQQRDPKALVYASRPERGLDVLLQSVFPRLLERDPKLTLYICGYDNTTEAMAPFYAHCQQLIANLGPRAKWMGYLKKADLYRLYSRAQALLYPSRSFEEVYCVRGDTLVDMPRDYRKQPNGIPIKELVGKKNFPVYCYDKEKGCITLGTVKWVKKTRRHAPIWKLTLDDGSILRATGDHPIMMRDESWKQLQNLKPGDSLMPLYKSIRVEVNLNNSKSEAEHRLVAKWKEQRELSSKEHADHIDGNSWNNAPENLQILQHSEHMRKTMKDAVKSGRVGNPVARRKQSLAVKQRMQTEEGRLQVQKYLGRNGHLAALRKLGPEGYSERQRINSQKFWDSLSGEERANFVTKRQQKIAAHYDQLRQNGSYDRVMQIRGEKIWQSRSARQNSLQINHKVVSVERDGYADVYDMEVEKYHNFVANGIVVHNCITATEAAACGLPFVGTTLGALPEVTDRVPGFAHLVPHPGDDASESFISAYVDAAWEVISNQGLNTQMSQTGLQGAEEYSWDKVAEQWEDFLLGAVELRSRDSRRLVRHWWRLGDVNGLNHLPEQEFHQLTTVQQLGVKEALEQDVPAAVPTHIVQAVAHSAAEVGAKTILALPGTQGLAEMKATAEMLNIQMVDEGKADFVYGIETLDCSADPHKHIAEAESRTNTGGHVCLIVTAPGTHQSRLMQGMKRRARWVFDNQDMRELTGHKPELLMAAIGGGDQSAYDHSVQAWSLHRWKVSGVKSEGVLNMDRRRKLQSPAPSLSGCLIVKDSEDSLHRCLKSIRHYCDEIVVDDNGSTDNTKAILAQYGIVPATGPSPIEVGFDEARNVNIGRATGDYILWIDSDEKLLDAFNLPKYLRWNLYDGYGVSQHHFSAVPQNAFKPDLPVRIFRRLKLDGTTTNIRFWGFVHEHPEKQINYSVGQSVVVSDVHLGHDGYLTESIRRKRFNRNIPLMFKDRLKYPDRVLGKFLMIRDWCHLGRYEIEQGGQRMTPQARAYLEAAVEAYRKDFLGLTHIMGMDGLQYYNEALQLLNKGFETQIMLKVGGLDGQPHEVMYSGRVASREDMEKLVMGSVRDLAGVWEGKYL